MRHDSKKGKSPLLFPITYVLVGRSRCAGCGANGRGGRNRAGAVQSCGRGAIVRDGAHLCGRGPILRTAHLCGRDAIVRTRHKYAQDETQPHKLHPAEQRPTAPFTQPKHKKKRRRMPLAPSSLSTPLFFLHTHVENPIPVCYNGNWSLGYFSIYVHYNPNIIVPHWISFVKPSDQKWGMKKERYHERY